MSKEKGKVNSPEDNFNLLEMNPDNPFNDGLDMEFQEEGFESSVIKKVPDNTEGKEDTDVIEGAAPKKTEPKAATTEEQEETEEDPTPKGKVETEETEEGAEDNGLHTFYSWLNEQGVVESLEEGKKVESEDDLKQVISTTIQKGIEDYKNSKSEEVQNFIDFVDNGGNPRDFHKLYYEQRSWKDIDPKIEANQELIVREAYKQSGWDDEDIDAEIADKKDLGRLETLSEKLRLKLIAGEEEDKKSLVEAQKQFQKEQSELAKKQWDEFKDNLYKKEEVQGFKLTPKVKDDLWSFMTKVDKKSGKTPLQLHNETNKDAQVLYAYLAMNNWDIQKLEKQVKTKVTSELSKKLKNITDTHSKLKGGSDSLTDIKNKNGGANFSAFKSIINQI